VNEPREEGEFADKVFEKDIVQMNVVVEIQGAVSIHTTEAIICHEAVFETVRK